MRVLAGTSGFAYKEWKGSFYPDDLSSKKMLAFYASRLPTVEINATFYRSPKTDVVAGWAAEVPDDFSFVLKASRRITHQARLGPGAESALHSFLDAARSLGPKLGPILFQLPPFLKKDVDRLHAFLTLLPSDVRAAFELRHESWCDPDVEQALRAHRAALVIADTEEAPDPALVATADWGYVRLRRLDYPDAAIAEWATRIRACPWKEAWVFFKHEDAGAGPRMAEAFLRGLANGATPGM